MATVRTSAFIVASIFSLVSGYQLNITVDDVLAEIYFDGVLYTGSLPNRAIFNVKDQIDLSVPPSLIAVKAKDLGGLYGILAHDSEGHITDASWKCTDTFYADWALATYDDSAWPVAVTKGTNRDRRRPTPDIDLSTTFIWSPVYNSVTKTCFCRLKISRACSVSVRAYGASDPGVPTEGYIKLNGVPVWEAGWYSDRLPNLRGVSVVIIDPALCTKVNDAQTFDTFESSYSWFWYYDFQPDSGADQLNAFLDALPDGSVIVGVTGDEPTRRLGSAVQKLASFGVYIDDVQYRGNFAFVAQKGSPAKTQLTKLLTSTSPFSSDLNVNVKGTAADVTIELVNKSP